MPIWGPYTGDPEKSASYLSGPHWNGFKGFRVIRGSGEFNHRFGGKDWIVPICRNCLEPLHQIFTFDLKDPRLKALHKNELDELPLVSCLNCSSIWKPQTFKLDIINKEVKVIMQSDNQNWVQADEDKIPTPLPMSSVILVEMNDDDIPVDRETYSKAFEAIGSEYVCRLLGAPLYAQNPIDIECPECKKEMTYIASIGSENYGETGQLSADVEFILGEMYLYFFLCKDCMIVKTEAQST